MKQIGWRLVNLLARMLDPDERDAVQGDFAESGQTAAQALRDLAGLVVRRRAAFWKDWRPWVAPIGLAVPVGLFFSRSYSPSIWTAWFGSQLRTIWTYGVRFQAGLPLADDLVTWVCFSFLPIAWLWSGGFALGSLARRAAWVHPAVIGPLLWFIGPLSLALFSSRLHGAWFWLLPQLALVLIPFLWGVRQGVRAGALRFGRVAWWAVALAVLTLAAQVEDGRSALAFAAWSRGAAWHGGLAWTPRLMPFAAIAWQFGLILAITRRRTDARPLTAH
jgi:hypothetical protein